MTTPENEALDLGPFMRELQFQAELVDIAKNQLIAAQQARDAGTFIAPDGHTVARHIFGAVQSILAGAAMVSKLLWPAPATLKPDGTPLEQEAEQRRQDALARGRALRAALGIKGNHLLQRRRVRNAFEHFDEKLDEVSRTDASAVIDQSIGIAPAAAFPGALTLRYFDVTQQQISVLDESVAAPELVNAVFALAEAAEAWLAQHGPPLIPPHGAAPPVP